jgi:hypothetical protein
MMLSNFVGIFYIGQGWATATMQWLSVTESPVLSY